MDFFVKPSLYRLEISRLNPFLKIQLFFDIVPEHSGNHVAQSVSGKVSKISMTPVHILQHSQRIIGRSDSQVILEQVFPHFR